MFHSYVTIPLQLFCQLVTSGNNVAVNATCDIDTQVAPVYNSTGSTTSALQDTPVTEQPTVLPDGYTAFPDIGVAYKYHNVKMTWDKAREYCMADGGSLAEIDSTQKLVRALELNITTGWAWTGIHRLFDNDKWTSLKTGLHLSMLPWAARSYADTKNADYSNHKCVQLSKRQRGLLAYSCIDSASVIICEIPL